jgi:DNA polymerase
LASIGVEVGTPEEDAHPQVAFFTNSILCLKEGGLQGTVRAEWFKNCSQFLRRQVEIVDPKVIVTLGEKAFRALLDAFGVKASGFKDAVESSSSICLPNGSRVVPVYHCGARILNTHRPFEQQLADWKRVAKALAPGA